MASTGDLDCQLGASEAIEEDGIFGDTPEGGSVEAQSRTPPTDSSRRSSASQQSESASVVPKQPPPLPPIPAAASASSGVRHKVEKQQQQRRKASLGGRWTDAAAAASGSSSSSSSSVFTLNHVKKIFGPHPKQQQSRRASSSSGSGLEQPAGDPEPLQRRLSRLSVDNLPAVFLAKSLGKAPADGLFGVDSVRRPVEALVRAAGKRKAKTGRPLPIAQLTVLPQGVSVRPHPQSDGGQVARDFHAIDSVSYAVMDPARQRVFCLVVAAAAAAAASAKPPVCHAFLCNSADTAYRLVLAVTFAFECAAATASGGGVGGDGGDAVEFGNA